MNKTLMSRRSLREDAPMSVIPLLRRLMCWEGFLLAVTLLVFVAGALASPYFLNIWNLSDATFNFTEKAIIVLPMAMLIIAREIDLSVASTMALSSTIMGFCTGGLADTDAGRRRAECRVAVRADQWPAGNTAESLFHRDHHRHHEPVSWHDLCAAGRSVTEPLSGQLRLVWAGICLGAAVV